MSSGTPVAGGLSMWIRVSVFIASPAAAADDRSWIERSDRNTAMVFDTLGAFYPEWMSSLGIEKFDTAVMDLKPDRVKRADAALGAAARRLSGLKAKEKDPRVRQDIDIVVEALERQRRTETLEDRLLIPFSDMPRQLFFSLQNLLDPRNPPERRAHALPLARHYGGLAPGPPPITPLHPGRIEGRAAHAKLLWPPKGQVQQGLHKCAGPIT